MRRLRLYDRITALPGVAALKPDWQRARCTANPARYMTTATSRRRTTAVYGLAEAPQVMVALRHGTHDEDTFSELFVADVYAEPAEVRTALAALGRPPVVADVGANVGMFAARTLARHPGARITSIEPDPANLEVLRRCAQANGDAFAVVGAAAATEPGELSFVAGQVAESHVGDGPDAITVPAVDLFATVPDADLLKIDVEGAEWPLLADPRLKDHPARVLALEFHPQGAPQADAHAAAHALVQAAGFHTVDVPTPSPPGYGSLWAWRA